MQCRGWPGSACSTAPATGVGALCCPLARSSLDQLWLRPTSLLPHKRNAIFETFWQRSCTGADSKPEITSVGLGAGDLLPLPPPASLHQDLQLVSRAVSVGRGSHHTRAPRQAPAFPQLLVLSCANRLTPPNPLFTPAGQPFSSSFHRSQLPTVFAVPSSLLQLAFPSPQRQPGCPARPSPS